MCILPIVLLFGEYTTVTWRHGHPTITFVTCTDAKICSIAQHHCLPLVCALLPRVQGHCAFFMLSAFPESQARTIPQVCCLKAKEERKTDQQQDGKDRVGKSLSAA